MIEVTCSIIEHNNKILVTQRSEKMALPLKWEFPGGKIEKDETAEACLIREILEELHINIKINWVSRTTSRSNGSSTIPSTSTINTFKYYYPVTTIRN